MAEEAEYIRKCCTSGVQHRVDSSKFTHVKEEKRSMVFDDAYYELFKIYFCVYLKLIIFSYYYCFRMFI